MVLNKLVRVIMENEYHYLHTFFERIRVITPINVIDYTRFLSCIVPSFIKVMFFINRNITSKFLVFLHGGVTNLIFRKKLLAVGLLITDGRFRNSVLNYFATCAVDFCIVLTQFNHAAFLKAALKKRHRIIYLTNSFSPVLHKPFMLFRCNVASLRMQFHFLRQLYYLKKIALLSGSFFTHLSTKYFVYKQNTSTLFILALTFKEYLYYNRSYIDYVINGFLSSINAGCVSLVVLVSILKKIFCIYNELLTIRVFKRFVFRKLRVQCYCHFGKYTGVCLYDRISSARALKLLMHFIAYKDLISPTFLDIPFLFNSTKPVSSYIFGSGFIKILFIK